MPAAGNGNWAPFMQPQQPERQMQMQAAQAIYPMLQMSPDMLFI